MIRGTDFIVLFIYFLFISAFAPLPFSTVDSAEEQEAEPDPSVSEDAVLSV